MKSGDGVFVAGYPGSTNRYNTTSELKFAKDWLYPAQAQHYQLQIDTMTLMGRLDKEIGIKYAGSIASMSNRLKKINGSLDGFRATDIVGIKQKRENDFIEWFENDPSTDKELLAKLESLLQAQQLQTQTNYHFVNAQSSALLSTAQSLLRLAKERQKPDRLREPGFQQRDMKMFRASLKRIETTFDPIVDRTLWLQDIHAYSSQPLQVEAFNSILLKSGNIADLDNTLDTFYSQTSLIQQENRFAWMGKSVAEFEASDDPFIKLAVALHDANMAIELNQKELLGRLNAVRPEYMKAIIAYYESNNWPVYPDANRTLRITYGMVDGYQSQDSVYKQPFSSLEGLLAKHTGKAPYKLPNKMLEAIKSNDYGTHRIESVYQTPRTCVCKFMSCLEEPVEFNSVPVNFLSSVDTTGGNSGSPVFNGNGELVGLNFDSTYEAITKDWFFNPTITRAIHVDIRYVLWMMDKVDHADNVIKELSLVRNEEQ